MSRLSGQGSGGQCQGKKAALKPLAQLPVWAFSG